ncbi:glycosyl hydrolase catalytic core-domain-containing protein [Crassisporium funariophilum]|nr:glycosyl hydrolase catalytic core-domain-containing protein [Crassisporium funariophilum]
MFTLKTLMTTFSVLSTIKTRVGAVPTVQHQLREVTNASKAGLAWPNADSVDMGQYQNTGKVSWYYTWSAFSTESDLEFVPMLWGNRSIDQFSSTIQQTLKETKPQITAILGMNEPEQKGQSNMTPQQGAQMWQTYLEPLRALGVRLGSPAPSSAPAGKVWLQDFFTACGGNCTVDFIAMHWYGTDASQFIAYLYDYHYAFQKPLWITEWACQNFVDFDEQCSQDDVVKFMNTTQSFMDNTEWVERYAWFGAMKDMQGVNKDNAIMDPNGHIDALGKQYIGAQGPQLNGNGTGMSKNGSGNLASAPLFLSLLFVLHLFSVLL